MAQVYIAYSRKDLSFVEQLAADLKSAGFDVWHDPSSNRGGSKWRSEVESGLNKSQFMVVVLSPDSVASEWVEREFLFANNLGLKIIPLMYRPCELPLNYVNLNYIDVQGENYRQHYEDLLRALTIDPKSATLSRTKKPAFQQNIMDILSALGSPIKIFSRSSETLNQSQLRAVSKARVFFAYSRKDLSFVEQLAADLKNAGFDVWYDVSRLAGGMRWMSEIETAIRYSEFVIVVLSPDSVASEWVDREFRFATSLRRKVIPLMHRSGDLPLQYINLNYIDVRGKNYVRNFEAILRALGSAKEVCSSSEDILSALRSSSEISSKSKAAFETYRTKLKEGHSLPLLEVKLLVVGQGAVGKTSLVQRILHSMFNPNQIKTEGISINQWQVDGSRESEVGNLEKSESQISNPDIRIKLNIWDFGGQEIMHATHQFFLTKRSLYVLVLDARLTQEENRVEYWLKIIQSFGGESPVLIVGNKTDQHPLDIDRKGLHKKYPNIVGILETSAATGAGIQALKAEIAKQVATLPYVRDLLPETWFTVKSKLEELAKNKNFFTQDEYLELCNASDVSDETSQHTLIGFLHDLGVVLHFQDDPRLEALGILNPQWVTNGVYKILNSHELFQNQGMLTLSLLNKILNLPEYPSNKRLFIVDMMKKFELCYDIEPDKSFLIPDLLPKDEIYTGYWDNTLAFQYHYNVLPSSIISRFIVRMNAFIYKNTIWRSGVVLKRGDNTALVKADTEDRKIYIWVSGKEDTRRDLLAIIRGEFDAIHRTIAKIEVTEKVPLPDAPEADPVPLAFLQRAEKEGRETLAVPTKDQIIDVIVKEILSKIQTESKGNITINIGGDVGGSFILGDENAITTDTEEEKK